PTLPEGLRVDTYDGSAWVGLIPFHLQRIAFRWTPAIPYFGSFPEANVRTYVVDPGGRRAIWFYSLDINRLFPTMMARTRYGLPYCWGRSAVRYGDHNGVSYRFDRWWPRRPSGRLAAEVEVGDPIPPTEVTELEHFLSARWGMATMRSGRLYYGPVHHQRWPLHRAHLVSLEQNLIEAAGLPSPEGEPDVLYSPGVRVAIGQLELIADRIGAAVPRAIVTRPAHGGAAPLVQSPPGNWRAAQSGD
ncbi:MAG: DUF2071 domain-containing protein, partial [Acidimicrobiales bacterium]|nr:DUF2071 domain-containing protein [Acidimicrobiales bacterium]